MKQTILNIVLIDSGVDRKHIKLKNKTIKDIDILDFECSDNIGHGTAVGFLLSDLIPNANIFSVKMFDKEYITTEDDLIKVLEYIYKFVDADIIHMSSGIIYIEDVTRLTDICEKLSKKGVVIVSAFNNEGVLSYPALLNNVIGVYWDRLCRSTKEYIYIENSPINILGYAGMQRLPWLNGSFKNVSGSSFSAPYITAKIAEYMMDNKKCFNDIMIKLKNDAKYTKIYTEQCNQANVKVDIKIKNAITFPLNKEIESILGNTDLVDFNILNVFDIPFYGRVGKNLKDIIYGVQVIDKEVMGYEQILWNEEFDTVILGHTKLLSEIFKKDFIKYFIDKCISYGKNLYSLDSLNDYVSEQNQIRKKGNWVFSFDDKNIEIEINTFGNLYKLGVPTLAIVGTSPRQGKYNLQLDLRRKFINAGYSVGQLGTEPTSFLFGMDIEYHSGYESNIELSPEKEVFYLNKQLAAIKDKDLIIIGTQSQTIPYTYGNLGFYTFSQHNILIATEPDAFILCINVTDEIEYIQRTIAYCESYFVSKVIGLCLFPLYNQREWTIQTCDERCLSHEDLRKFRQEIEHSFNIPVYVNGDENDMKELYIRCTDYFTE